MVRFIVVFYFLVGTIIYLKCFISPTFLHIVIPLSDFQSTLYEIVILIFGVLTGFLYFLVGSFARYRYRLPFVTFFCSLCIFYASIVLLYWLNLQPFLTLMGELWLDLLGEPYRLLLLNYKYSNTISLLLLFVLTGSGYMKQLSTDERVQNELVRDQIGQEFERGGTRE